MMEVFKLSLNDVLGYKVVVHAHGYRFPSLDWAITIHKAQGLTLDKVAIDLGKEVSAGLTFVACSCVRRLSDIMFDPAFAYQRITSLGKSMRLTERKVKDARLCSTEHTSFPS